MDPGVRRLAPAAHVVVYALGTTALVMATLFSIVGAVVFGKFLGSLYNVTGTTGGAVLSFLAARYLGRDFAARWVSGKLRTLDGKAEKDDFGLVCCLRLAYLPFAPLNYATGLTRIRFLDSPCGTVLGLLPGMFVITDSVDELTNPGSSWELLKTIRFLVPLTLFVLSRFLPVMIKRLMPTFHSLAASPGA